MRPRQNPATKRQPTWVAVFFLRIITKSNGLEGALDAELLARKIPEMLPEFGEQFGTDASLDEIPISQKKGFLKLHAARELMRHYTSLSEEDATKKIHSVEPQKGLIFSPTLTTHRSMISASS